MAFEYWALVQFSNDTILPFKNLNKNLNKNPQISNKLDCCVSYSNALNIEYRTTNSLDFEYVRILSIRILSIRFLILTVSRKISPWLLFSFRWSFNSQCKGVCPEHLQSRHGLTFAVLNLNIFIRQTQRTVLGPTHKRPQSPIGIVGTLRAESRNLDLNNNNEYHCNGRGHVDGSEQHQVSRKFQNFKVQEKVASPT